MAVAVEIAVHVTGDGETERSLREGLAWAETIRHSPEYHEIVAQFAIACARSHWRAADQLRAAAADRQRRRAAREARKR